MSPADMSETDSGQGVNPDALPAPLYVHVLRALTAVFLFAMMALGFTDVVLRYLFNAPIQGAFPIMGFLLGLVVFSSLPLISRDDRHITVDLFENLFSSRLGAISRWVASLCSIAATGFIAERMWAFSIRRYEMGQLHDMIDVELWPFAMAFAVLSAFTCLMLATRLFLRLRNETRFPAAGDDVS